MWNRLAKRIVVHTIEKKVNKIEKNWGLFCTKLIIKAWKRQPAPSDF